MGLYAQAEKTEHSHQYGEVQTRAMTDCVNHKFEKNSPEPVFSISQDARTKKLINKFLRPFAVVCRKTMSYVEIQYGGGLR